MYEFKFVWRYSTLIIPWLIARRQSIDDSLQKLPDSVLKLVSRASPLTESMCSPKRSGNRSWPWIVESLIFCRINRKVIGNFLEIWKRAADSGSRAVYGVGLQPLACRDCRFESLQGHECLSLLRVVFCRVEVTATGRSLVLRSPTGCTVFERDFETSTMRRPRLLGLSNHEKKKHCQLNGLLNYNSWVLGRKSHMFVTLFVRGTNCTNTVGVV